MKFANLKFVAQKCNLIAFTVMSNESIDQSKLLRRGLQRYEDTCIKSVTASDNQ